MLIGLNCRARAGCKIQGEAHGDGRMVIGKRSIELTGRSLRSTTPQQLSRFHLLSCKPQLPLFLSSSQVDRNTIQDTPSNRARSFIRWQKCIYGQLYITNAKATPATSDRAAPCSDATDRVSLTNASPPQLPPLPCTTPRPTSRPCRPLKKMPPPCWRSSSTTVCPRAFSYPAPPPCRTHN